MIPVFVITGFLGSGKTTLLNRLVRHPAMSDSAVVVNEFGEIGLDHLLVESAHENTVLLSSGCLCCTVRGDLVDTLSDLHGKRAAGEVPEFARVVIETTGLADPAPVLRTLIGETAVIERFRLAGVVTTLDAMHGMGQLDEHRESYDQVAVADVVVLTKTDIAPPRAAAALRERLARIAPTARILDVVKGDVDPGVLLSGLGAAGDAGVALGGAADHDHGHGHDGIDVNRHDDRIAAISVVRDRPLAWPAVRTWLQSIASLRGNDLLRVKGIVNVAGIDAPVIIHGVQHVFDPPRRLERWPDDDRRTRIVMIARDLDGIVVNAALDAAIGDRSRRDTVSTPAT
jgi:G3E family GTPase